MDDFTSFEGSTRSSLAPVGSLSLLKEWSWGLEGLEGWRKGGGVFLDCVVMERKKQEEGFADRIAR